MAKLTSGERNDLSSSTFGLPAERKYPMPDANHARVAKSYASKEYNAGQLSGAQKAQIDAKANAKLGHPRQHSLAMASADTLHKAGYISTAHKDAIRAHAGQKLQAHKQAKAAPAFGSLAPATPMDDQGGGS